MIVTVHTAAPGVEAGASVQLQLPSVLSVDVIRAVPEGTATMAPRSALLTVIVAVVKLKRPTGFGEKLIEVTVIPLEGICTAVIDTANVEIPRDTARSAIQMREVVTACLLGSGNGLLR
jgi:Flp pilus assembly protein CpaB